MIARVSTILCAVFACATPAYGQAGAPAGGVAAPVMAPVAQAVTAGANGLTVTALPNQTLGQIGRFNGNAPAGRIVRLQRLDAKTQKWRQLKSVRADAAGAYTLRWRPDHIGPTSLRVILHTTSAPIDVTVYKPALATWYGPGFFGKQTACGMPLTPDLQGLAHRNLPCGTQVAITYAGRSVVLPVIDRGPYGVAGAEWDLTQAAALTLGITATTTLGAVRLRDQPVAASK
jgi:peptidoglycan lytic transglycosylase